MFPNAKPFQTVFACLASVVGALAIITMLLFTSTELVAGLAPFEQPADDPLPDNFVYLPFVQTAPPPPSGVIVFDSWPTHEIFTIHADGAQLTSLTPGSWGNDYPSWSPDGSQIVFVSNRGEGLRNIFVMNADGSDVTALTQGYHNQYFYPKWSPDGGKIIFSAYESPFAHFIMIMNADGTELDVLVGSDIEPTNPEWSPTGDKIIFCGEPPELTGYVPYDLYTIDSDGANLTNLTNTNDVSECSPDWSPDGGKIVYGEYIYPDQHSIWMINTDGSERTQITANSWEDIQPSWSPDGNMIVYTSNREGHYQLHIMKVDGSWQKRLTNNATNDWSPDWKAPAT